MTIFVYFSKKINSLNNTMYIYFGGVVMEKKLSYRRARKGVAEQYNVSINQDIIRSLGITPNDRRVEIFYDRTTKRLIIRKSEENKKMNIKK